MSENQMIFYICEKAATCGKRDSDGNLCQHATPHIKNSGCEVQCTSVRPFGALCARVDVKEGKEAGE